MVKGKFKDEPKEVIEVLNRAMLDIEIKNGKLYKLVKGELKLFPPPSERTKIIMQAHRAVGHGGLVKTL